MRSNSYCCSLCNARRDNYGTLCPNYILSNPGYVIHPSSTFSFCPSMRRPMLTLSSTVTPTQCNPETISLYALAEFVDQNVDRLHVVGIQLLLRLELGRHMLNGGIERSLEIADRGRQGEDCLLADLLLGVGGGHTDERRDSADYKKLETVSMVRSMCRVRNCLPVPVF
jgi:hypothetical protein